MTKDKKTWLITGFSEVLEKHWLKQLISYMGRLTPRYWTDLWLTGRKSFVPSSTSITSHKLFD